MKNDLGDKREMGSFYFDLFFSPKDTLSGDSYSIRALSASRYLYFIIDGMGKGISASVTAMLCCAYINHIVDTKNLESLGEIILELIGFIGKNLLPEEVVSATFLLFDEEEGYMYYSMFSMPAILYVEEGANEVSRVKSNNPPLAFYTKKVNVSRIETKRVQKLLCYSDGLDENHLRDNSEDTYGDLLMQHFLESSNASELETKRTQHIVQQEDDITYFFLYKKATKEV